MTPLGSRTSRWDSGLICERYAVRGGQLSTQEWTEEEDWIVRRMWAHADRFELAKALPMKSRTTIHIRASELGIGRRELCIARSPINVHHLVVLQGLDGYLRGVECRSRKRRRIAGVRDD